MKTKRSFASDLVLGAAAGVVGSWLMGQATSLLYSQESEEIRKREQAIRGGKASFEVAAEKAGRAVGEELDENQRKQVGGAMHWGIGIGAGAVYGALRPRVPWISAGFGTLYGAMFFLVMDEGVNTAFGLTPPPQEFPWQPHGRGLAGHVVLGVTTEAVLNLADAPTRRR